MKLRVSLFVLLIGLALTGCHRGGVYSATADVKLYSEDPNSWTPQDPPARYVQNEVEVMQSPDVLVPIIRDLNLDHIWAKRLNKGEALPMEDALKYLQSRLRLEPKPASMIISITATSNVPQEAADIANSIADHYKAMRDHAVIQLEQSGIEVLKDQIAQEKQTVKDAEAQAQQYPQNTDLKKRIQVDQSMLQALTVKLQQDEQDIKLSESPVRILSRARAPPE